MKKYKRVSPVAYRRSMHKHFKGYFSSAKYDPVVEIETHRGLERKVLQTKYPNILPPEARIRIATRVGSDDIQLLNIMPFAIGLTIAVFIGMILMLILGWHAIWFSAFLAVYCLLCLGMPLYQYYCFHGFNGGILQPLREYRRSQRIKKHKLSQEEYEALCLLDGDLTYEQVLRMRKKEEKVEVMFVLFGVMVVLFLQWVVRHIVLFFDV